MSTDLGIYVCSRIVLQFRYASLTDEAVDDTTSSEKSDSEPAVSAPVPDAGNNDTTNVDTSYDSIIREADMRSMQSGNWLTDNAVHVGLQEYVNLFGLLSDGVSQVVAGP